MSTAGQRAFSSLGPSTFQRRLSCESLSLLGGLAVGDFNAAGCQWGKMPTEVFEAR